MQVDFGGGEKLGTLTRDCSVIYQEILQEGEERGEARLILRLLTRRIGEVAPQLRSQIQSLSLNQIEELGEALLDFSSPADLDNWLRSYL
jgi:predicted transposase YdaD